VSEPPAVPAEPEGPPSPAYVAAAYAVVLLLTVLLTLYGAFLVPLRVAGVLVPVSWLLVAVANVGVVVAGRRLAGVAGAAVPALVWLAMALLLAGRRTEGDLIVVASYVGYGYLLVGALAAAIAFGFVSGRRGAVASGASPGSRARR
jgi:hypothetical protein